VLAASSSDYAYVPIFWASVQWIFLLQLVVFILAGFIFSWMPVRLALVPRAVRRARAHRAALEKFVIRHVTHTRNRCGILIVSMAEHYARVIADEGIAQKVSNAEWQAAIDVLIAHIRDGRIAAGFVAATQRCGAVLAAHAGHEG
jgi:putative membrane protein